VKSKEIFPAVFSRHAAAYKERVDAQMGTGALRSRFALVEWADPRSGDRILDLACGPGTMTLHIAGLVAPDGEAVGVDLAPGMIEAARRAADGRGLPVRFELMDLEDLRIADATFDAAVCAHGLQFCPDLSRALSEAHRVLRSRARFAASIPLPRKGRVEKVLRRALYELLPEPVSAPDLSATERTVRKPEDFAAAAHQAGFTPVHTELLEEESTFMNPAEYLRLSRGWWSLASRLEQVDSARGDALMAQAGAALESEFGTGPLKIASPSVMLYAES
jgi:ubiquinone/menaquinone biosynthesis C-methylase UbiE